MPHAFGLKPFAFKHYPVD